MLKRAMRCGAVIAAVGCGSVLSPSAHRLAVIEGAALDANTVVPDTVTVGREFDVLVFGYDGGCWEPGKVSVEIQGLHASVAPFVQKVSGSCAQLQRFDEYRAGVTFSEVGEGVITFRGLSTRADSLGSAEPRVIMLDRRVVVR